MQKPPEGRRARNGYPSQEDFATMVGVTRGTVQGWETGKGYPDPPQRARLAELSRGRFSPEDFKRPGEAEYRDLDARTRALEERLRIVESQLGGVEDRHEEDG